MKEDIFNYLRIFAGTMLVSPIVFFTLYDDLGLESAIIITSIVYLVIMCLAIPMFNYLQYGTFTIIVSDADRKDPYRIKRDAYKYKQNYYKSRLF